MLRRSKISVAKISEISSCPIGAKCRWQLGKKRIKSGNFPCTTHSIYDHFCCIEIHGAFMGNTYSQIHIQCVAAVKYRRSLIALEWKEELHKYITGIVQNNGHKMIEINTMPDHLHFLFGCRPDQSISDLMRFVKGDSSEWINKEKFCPSTFRWQGGFGAFSYSKSQIPIVANYIHNQEKHHRKKTFLDEYTKMLEKTGITYDPRYIFKPLE